MFRVLLQKDGTTVREYLFRDEKFLEDLQKLPMKGYIMITQKGVNPRELSRVR